MSNTKIIGNKKQDNPYDVFDQILSKGDESLRSNALKFVYKLLEKETLKADPERVEEACIGKEEYDILMKIQKGGGSGVALYNAASKFLPDCMEPLHYRYIRPYQMFEVTPQILDHLLDEYEIRDLKKKIFSQDAAYKRISKLMETFRRFQPKKNDNETDSDDGWIKAKQWKHKFSREVVHNFKNSPLGQELHRIFVEDPERFRVLKTYFSLYEAMEESVEDVKTGKYVKTDADIGKFGIDDILHLKSLGAKGRLSLLIAAANLRSDDGIFDYRSALIKKAIQEGLVSRMRDMDENITKYDQTMTVRESLLAGNINEEILPTMQNLVWVLREVIPFEGELPVGSRGKILSKKYADMKKAASRLKTMIGTLEQMYNELSAMGESENVARRIEIGRYYLSTLDNLARETALIAEWNIYYEIIKRGDDEKVHFPWQGGRKGAVVVSAVAVKKAEAAAGRIRESFAGEDINSLWDAYKKELELMHKDKVDKILADYSQVVRIAASIVKDAGKSREILSEYTDIEGEMKGVSGDLKTAQINDLIKDVRTNFQTYINFLNSRSGRATRMLMNDGDPKNDYWQIKNFTHEMMNIFEHLHGQLMYNILEGRIQWQQIDSEKRHSFLSDLYRLNTFISAEASMLMRDQLVKGMHLIKERGRLIKRVEIVDREMTYRERESWLNANPHSLYLDLKKAMVKLEEMRDGTDLIDFILNSNESDVSNVWKTVDKKQTEIETYISEHYIDEKLVLLSVASNIAADRLRYTKWRGIVKHASENRAFFGAVDLEKFGHWVGKINELSSRYYFSIASDRARWFETRVENLQRKLREIEEVGAKGKDVSEFKAGYEDERDKLIKDIDFWNKGYVKHELGYRVREDFDFINFRQTVWFYEDIYHMVSGGLATHVISPKAVKLLMGVGRKIKSGLNKLNLVRGAGRSISTIGSAAGKISAAEKILDAVVGGAVFHWTVKASSHYELGTFGEELLQTINSIFIIAFFRAVGRRTAKDQKVRLNKLAERNSVKSGKSVETEMKSLMKNPWRRGAYWTEALANEYGAFMAVDTAFAPCVVFSEPLKIMGENIQMIVGLRAGGKIHTSVSEKRDRKMFEKIEKQHEELTRIESEMVDFFDINKIKNDGIRYPVDVTLSKARKLIGDFKEGLELQKRNFSKLSPHYQKHFERDVEYLKTLIIKAKVINEVLEIEIAKH